MNALNHLIDKIKAFKNTEDIIREVIEIIKIFIKETKIQNTVDAQYWLQKIERAIRQECPNALPVLNFLIRASTIISDKKFQITADQLPEKDFKFIRTNTTNVNSKELDKKSLTQAFRALEKELDDFDTINENIISFACTHLGEGETILVYCQSRLMTEFVEVAIEEKRVQAIIVVSDLGANVPLENSNKSVTYISEQSVFSVINQASKVFMDCHSVMADGSVINTSGTFITAIMAKEYSIPVLVLAPMHHFTPKFTFNQEKNNEVIPPQTIFRDAFSLSNLEVVVVKHDLISPDYVSLIITQLGEFSNSYIYQAYQEYYQVSDKFGSTD